MIERVDEWVVGGRHYTTTWASDPDGFALELDDVAPAPGRGIVLRAWRSDDTGETTVECYVQEGLPLQLVEQFILKARERL